MGTRTRRLRLFLTDVDRERAWDEVRSRVPGTKLLDDDLIFCRCLRMRSLIRHHRSWDHCMGQVGSMA